jgi:hypothetical protein
MDNFVWKIVDIYEYSFLHYSALCNLIYNLKWAAKKIFLQKKKTLHAEKNHMK